MSEAHVWAAHFASAAVQAGVSAVVICPGARSTPLALAFAERVDIQRFSCIDERVAGFFALGLCKGSGKRALAVCTSGSAGAHFLPALIEASLSRVPLWVATADRPFELQGFGAPQTIPQEGLFGRFVSAAFNLPLPDLANLPHLAAIVCRAASIQGPVHFNFPFREPLAPEAPLPVARAEMAMVQAQRRLPDLSELAERLSRAERGALVCGPRPPGDGFGDAVNALAAHLGFPLLAEATSNARYGFPEAIAMYDVLLSRRPPPDVVVRFGGTPTQRSLQQWRGDFNCIVSERDAWQDPGHVAHMVVEAEATALCRELQRLCPPMRGWRAEWLDAEASARQRLQSERAWGEELLAREVVKALPVNANLMVSSSMPIRDVDAFAPTAQGNLRVHCNRGANGVDGITSTALGIAAATGAPTAVYLGDVACLHDVSAWLLARQLAVSLCAVVVNNDGGGIFHFLARMPTMPHFERYFGTPHGMGFACVAELGAASYTRAEDFGQLAGAVSHGMSGGLHLIELQCSRQGNVDSHRALKERLVESGA